MRRITIAVAGTVAALVLLFSYRTSLGGPVSAGAPPGVVRGTTPTPATSGASPARSGGTVTTNGTVVDNGYGPIQVQVRIAGGRIVDVVTLATPGDGHSRRINSVAVPQLRQEALTAQSAHIDTVSGATATSDAYRGSLQAALDAAHFRPGS